MRKKVYRIAFFIAATACTAVQGQQKIDLAGNWLVALDSARVSSPALPETKAFSLQVALPGTLDDAGIGYPPRVTTDVMNKEVMRNLWRKNRFVGTAWYRRVIEVPKSFGQKKLKLLLERVIWKTTVFIDGKELGSAASLSAPQEFALPALAPGKHSIVLRVNNRQQFSIGDATHAYTDGTQIIWNGVIGKMEITAQEQSIDGVMIIPDIEQNKVLLQVKLNAVQHQEETNHLKAVVAYKGKPVISKSIVMSGSSAVIELPITQAKLWDEFSPNLYTATVKLLKGTRVADSYTGNFGMRRLSNRHGLLQINEHRMFLRGTLECAVFPLTGHPPMQKAGWLKLMKTAKSYGLNHLRFHSWCPPEAAFAVADSLGLYLQVELPFWAGVPEKEDPTLRFLKQEAARIIKNYGNHPSFCFFSMGNELEGNFNWLNALVQELKSQDARHLYTTTSFSFGKGSWPQPEDQYYITQWTRKGWVRGQGIFNTRPPRFDEDYRRSIDSVPVPVVTHEIGQYSVYPNMKEIRKYTGVLEPLNFITIKKDLEKKGLLPLAGDFLKASGKLAADLYKEEIERALKTPRMSGFQLLDLHDFPGQSTALVGLLDAFWDNKGIIGAKDFSKFCGPVVPLLRFEKAVYTSDETFSGIVEMANFTNAPLKNTTVIWSVADAAGKKLGGGEWQAGDIPVGNGNHVGKLEYALKNVTVAKKLIVKLQVKNAGYSNEWPVWVYPPTPVVKADNVCFTTLPDEALRLLDQGKNVVLNPDTAAVKGVAGRYTTVFWSPVHFPDQPGAMGLLIDSSSKAFSRFPTETYSTWQWWDMVLHSKSMILDGLPVKIKPLVRVVDNFFKNRSMAALIEVKAGKGKLIICSMDLHTNLEQRPAARQLRYSLMQYAGSDQFNPSDALSNQTIKGLFR
ncbi:sugar-binding domain-containing protein [Niabella hirudinis]|uniref:sugar-binding domain-containing protein n=1 Tax=Niabella hirudinis TaxID=1285929 RepID=UPI003EBBB939